MFIRGGEIISIRPQRCFGEVKEYSTPFPGGPMRFDHGLAWFLHPACCWDQGNHDCTAQGVSIHVSQMGNEGA